MSDLFNTSRFYLPAEKRMPISQQILQNKTLRLNFGKHKGELFSDLYRDPQLIGYLFWMVHTYVYSHKTMPFPDSWASCILGRASQFGWYYNGFNGKCYRKTY